MAARERLTRGSTPKHTRGPNRPSFEPGRAKTGGRTAGTPNRLTLDVKQAILAGFSADAADGKGPIPPGLAGAAWRIIHENTGAAAMLLRALIPHHLRVTGGQNVAEYQQKAAAEMRQHLIDSGIPVTMIAAVERRYVPDDADLIDVAPERAAAIEVENAAGNKSAPSLSDEDRYDDGE